MFYLPIGGELLGGTVMIAEAMGLFNLVKGLTEKENYDPFAIDFPRQLSLLRLCCSDLSKCIEILNGDARSRKSELDDATYRLVWTSHLMGKHPHTRPVKKILDSALAGAKKASLAKDAAVALEAQLQFIRSFADVTEAFAGKREDGKSERLPKT